MSMKVVKKVVTGNHRVPRGAPLGRVSSGPSQSRASPDQRCPEFGDRVVAVQQQQESGSSGMNVGDWGGLAIGFSLWGNGLGLDRAGRYLYPFFPPASNPARAAMTKRSAFGALPS